jgi:hypothetical protein
MVMPLCGTFHYSGIVPAAVSDRTSGRWKLKDASFDDRNWLLKLWDRDRLRDSRLVGLQPALRAAQGTLLLSATDWLYAQLSAAAIQLHPALTDSFEGADLLTLSRSGTASVGVSLVRADKLVWAVGAVVGLPMGTKVKVRGGPEMKTSMPEESAWEEWERSQKWVEVTQSVHCARLHKGAEATVGDYRVSVIRPYEFGIPGKAECVAISTTESGLHEPALAAAHLLAGPNAGLGMFRRDPLGPKTR